MSLTSDRVASPLPTQALQRLQRVSLLVGAIGVVASGIGFVRSPDQFFPSYLVAYLLWLGIALGCLGMSLIHTLTGGRWGVGIRDELLAAAETLPLLALLFLPVVAGIPALYVWSHPEVVARDPSLQHQQVYLNVPFFLARAAFYLIVWIALARARSRWTDEAVRTGDLAIWAKLRRLGGGGLVALGLTVTFAMLDWTMSLNPSWSSTIYPAIVGVGHLLAGFAFAVLVVSRLGERARPGTAASVLPLPQLLNDLGGLLLALVMLWAYLSFSQLLLIWAGNLNAEVPWYIRRVSNGWQWVGIFLIASQFVVPFGSLLSRDVKRNATAMSTLAILLVVGRLVELTWLVEPNFPPVGLAAHWLDLATAIGLGGIWVAAFARNRRRRFAAEEELR